MPVIKITTNVKVDNEKKTAVTREMIESVAKVEEYVSGNISFTFQDDIWMNFRKDCEKPTLLVEFEPGPMTPVTDYKAIVDDFFLVFTKEFPEIDKSRIYVTVAQIDHWGWNGGLLGG